MILIVFTLNFHAYLFFQAAREICKPTCQLKCTERITQEMVQANFDKYYAYKDADSKRAFLDKRMRPVQAKRARNKAKNPLGRTNYEYILWTRNQTEFIVCRTAFHNVFCISQQVSLHIIKTRKENPAGTPKPDARGRGK